MRKNKIKQNENLLTSESYILVPHLLRWTQVENNLRVEGACGIDDTLDLVFRIITFLACVLNFKDFIFG